MSTLYYSNDEKGEGSFDYYPETLDEREAVKIIIVKEGVKEIPSYFAGGFPNLRTVKLPDTIVSIGERAFLDANYGLKINFPEGLKHIKKKAFNTVLGNGKGELILPNNLLTIEDDVFTNCSGFYRCIIPEKCNVMKSNFPLSDEFLENGLRIFECWEIDSNYDSDFEEDGDSDYDTEYEEDSDFEE
jgi:hypothetical protein